ncbi:XRE family transcriptional regulator [Moraxella bovoculi]|uniref:XRE family transcriptional regulator n=1 Tax=Moraxella bovoculi TaxID=386891 RepID=UPI0009BA3F1B|nr:S24 family peptidase [Moraxella bovoculi]
MPNPSNAAFAERLNLAMNRAGLEISDLSEQSEISYEMIRRYTHGIAKPRDKGLKKIAECLSVSASWLDYGEGEMSVNNGISVVGNNTNNSTQIGRALHSNISSNFEQISDWDSSTPLDDAEVEVLFYKDFGVACGHGTDSVAYENEWRRLRMSRATIDHIGSHYDKIFATLADGNSMSPTINDGDTIWVDMSKETIKDGKIFVFEYGGLFMCKRLYRLPNNGLKVVSDNEIDYPTFEITGEQREQNGFRLIGWVWHWSVMERW